MNTNYGYVYCIINIYIPDKCKIGMVYAPNKTSHMRAKELSSNTNCLKNSFKVCYDIKVKNPQKYEKRIHEKLKNLRINTEREFFDCKPYDILEYFKITNLIIYDDEKFDFAENYFTNYDNYDNYDNSNTNNNISDVKNNNISDVKNNNDKYKIKIMNIKNNLEINNINTKNNHKCDKCGKEFKYASVLQRHITKKFSCNNSLNITNSYDTKNKEIDIEIKIKIIKSKETGNKCLFCNHIFNQKSSLTRHINTYCDVKKNLHIKKVSLLNEKNKLLEEIKKEEEINEKINEKLCEKNNEINILKNIVKNLLNDKSKNINIINNK